MDENLKRGDIITFRLHGDDYGLAHLLHVENLATYDHYHLAVLDAVLRAEDGGVDSYGVLINSLGALERAQAAPVVIDHIALTLEAFSNSSPSKVDSQEVSEDDLAGYYLWLHAMRADLLRRGVLRPDDDRKESSGDTDDAMEYEDDIEEMDEYLGAEEPGSVEEELDAMEREEGEEELYQEYTEDELKELESQMRPWHRGLYSRPLGEVLFEMHDVFGSEEFQGTKLSAYVTGFFGNNAALEEMVNRFINEGDYAAGHELMAFGDAAADALGRHLQEGGIDPQAAEDILNILSDMGTMRAYEHIVQFFLQHEGNVDDPLGLPSARAFAYVVMLTGGTPPPLHQHLGRLDDIPYTELEHDVAAAKEAVANAPTAADAEGGTPQASSDPFGGR